MNSQIHDIRNKIDHIDDAIFDLLKKRIFLAKELVKIKNQEKKEIFDPKREEEIFNRLIKKIPQDIVQKEKIIYLWKNIIEICRDIQENNSK